VAYFWEVMRPCITARNRIFSLTCVCSHVRFQVRTFVVDFAAAVFDARVTPSSMQRPRWRARTCRYVIVTMTIGRTLADVCRFPPLATSTAQAHDFYSPKTGRKILNKRTYTKQK